MRAVATHRRALADAMRCGRGGAPGLWRSRAGLGALGLFSAAGALGLESRTVALGAVRGALDISCW